MKLQPATSPLCSFWAAALKSSQVLAGLQAGGVEQILAVEIDDRAGVQAGNAVDVGAVADVMGLQVVDADVLQRAPG